MVTRPRLGVFSGVMFAGVVLLGACGGNDAPQVPLGPDGEPDPVLEVGRVAFEQRCAVCHGAQGQGGRGKRLNNGQIFELHPEIDTMLAAISDGKGNGMPAFADVLEPDEIEAVARYVREVLN